MSKGCETCKQILDWLQEGHTNAANNLIDEHLHDLALAGVRDRGAHPGVRR